MINVIVELSKYIILTLMIIYTFHCFYTVRQPDEEERNELLRQQLLLIFFIDFTAFLVLYLKTFNFKIVEFYAEMLLFFAAIQILYRLLYKKASILLLNNMCMLLSVGFIMLCRLDISSAQKQLLIAAGVSAIALVIPVMIRKMRFLRRLTWVYAGIGIILLAAVFALARTSYGAKLSLLGVQPSEAIKITFVFFMASFLSRDTSFKAIVQVTVVAALHVGILVLSKDLGSAVIFFVAYLVMVYVATRNVGYLALGIGGGSAAAVAANECFAALGSDTGGSIRQPASYCGVVGMKPTYGTVSRYGLIAYGSSLDQIGPLCKDVTDCATIMEVIAAKDDKDSTSVKREDTAFTKALIDDVKGLKIGIPRDYFGDGLDPEVKEAVMSAAKVLEEKGAIVEEFDLSLVEYAIPTYYTIAAAEASSNLERFDGVKYGYRTSEYDGLHNMYKKTRSEGFGPEVKRRIMLGSFVLSSGYYDAYYLKALRVKALIKKAFDEAFAKYDVILGPVAPTTAPKIGSSLADPIKMYLGDIYTISVNLAGLPGISVPCGKDSKGLPIGVQLIGDCFKENNIIRAAYSYEQARGRFE